MPFKRMNPGCCDCVTGCCVESWADTCEVEVTTKPNGGVNPPCVATDCDTLVGSFTCTRLDEADWYDPPTTINTSTTRCAQYELTGIGGAGCQLDTVLVDTWCSTVSGRYVMNVYFLDGNGDQLASAFPNTGLTHASLCGTFNMTFSSTGNDCAGNNTNTTISGLC